MTPSFDPPHIPAELSGICRLLVAVVMFDISFVLPSPYGKKPQPVYVARVCNN